MIRTGELREEQIKSLFPDRLEDWNNVLAQKNLRILLKNPMMALLYASTCPIVEKNADLDYLDWITPISNASDLLHDYYMAQIAILINRGSVDGGHIMNCLIAVDRLLPALAYKEERANTTVWKEDHFDADLNSVIKAFYDRFSDNSNLPGNIKRVRRLFRLHQSNINQDDLYDLIISELCLLKSGNGRVAFAHQIFRDYLAAVYLHHSLVEKFSVDELWHNEEIHKGVVQYLRYIGNETTWGSGGTVSKMLLPYRGREADKGDWFVSNTLSCWLSVGDGERDLSNLDLREVSLTDHLRVRFNGTIDIENAMLSKATLINDERHDEIIGISFSHDNRTMAAVSKNGVVSVNNLITQSQMIVGELGQCEVESTVIGFDADDYLIVGSRKATYKWPTIAYDKIVEGKTDAIIGLDTIDEETKNKIEDLENELKASDLDGVYRKHSENGRYFASALKAGFCRCGMCS